MSYVSHCEEMTGEGVRVAFTLRLKDNMEGGTWKKMVEWGKEEEEEEEGD